MDPSGINTSKDREGADAGGAELRGARPEQVGSAHPGERRRRDGGAGGGGVQRPGLVEGPACDERVQLVEVLGGRHGGVADAQADAVAPVKARGQVAGRHLVRGVQPLHAVWLRSGRAEQDTRSWLRLRLDKMRGQTQRPLTLTMTTSLGEVRETEAPSSQTRDLGTSEVGSLNTHSCATHKRTQLATAELACACRKACAGRCTCLAGQGPTAGRARRPVASEPITRARAHLAAHVRGRLGHGVGTVGQQHDPPGLVGLRHASHAAQLHANRQRAAH